MDHENQKHILNVFANLNVHNISKIIGITDKYKHYSKIYKQVRMNGMFIN